jgi:uncharacterized membrane protein YtjA (UPF0391 family)
VSDAYGMVTRPARPISNISDDLYRWRWWLSAILIMPAVFGFHVFDGAASPATWVLFALFVILLWIPMLIRWTRAARDAGTAFREGLES